MNWEAITAISTFLLTVATAAMAVATKNMAKMTREALKQNDELRKDTNTHYEQTRNQDKQHHEDGFRPVLLLATGQSRPSDRNSALYTNPSASPPVVIVSRAVSNIGKGPALGIHMFIRKDEKTGFGPSIEITSIEAGGFAHGLSDRFVLPVVGDVLNSADLSTLKDGPWLIVLEYEDIFGNRFHSLHYKNPLKPWGVTGRGPARDTTPVLPA